MEDKILDAIKGLEKAGISNINILALVSSTSYEVIFYGDYKGEIHQSNEMAESGIIAPNVVDDFYKQIATVIRESDGYSPEKMNIVIRGKDGNISVLYDEKNCRVHKIKREWKSSL